MAEPFLPLPADWNHLKTDEVWDHVRQVLDMPGGFVVARLLIDLEDPHVNPDEAAAAALKAGMSAEEIARLLLSRPHQHGQLWGTWAGERKFDPDALLPRPTHPVIHRDLMVRQGDAFAADAWRAWWATNPADLLKPWFDPSGALRTAEGAPQPLHGLAWALWHGQDRAAEVWWGHLAQLPASALDEAWVALTARLLFKNTGSGSPLMWREGPPALDVVKWATRLLDAGARPHQEFRMDLDRTDIGVRPDNPSASLAAAPHQVPPGPGVWTTTLHAWMAAFQRRQMGDTVRQALWTSVIQRLPWSEAGPDERGRTCADLAIEMDQQSFDQGNRRRAALQSLLEASGAWCPTVHAARWMWRSFKPCTSDREQGEFDAQQQVSGFWRQHAAPVIEAPVYQDEVGRVWAHHPPSEHTEWVNWWGQEADPWATWLAPELRDHWAALVAAVRSPDRPLRTAAEKSAWQFDRDLFKQMSFVSAPSPSPSRPRL